ncbi:37S ribosomal protein NAM9, mitochondrial [Lachnellula subtilissima]|uniref:37S ribosomal protein NAM9, mitochondrial n=1 Tax=Lachnellula subtilissima TaxID=602034 RepID=A0A8H8RH51_9HELO|nr:37S ribosomal protein NAM9, mitochondrial [Lachnellula subtilissima]
MSRKRFHGLKRIVPRFRMTWNKYNLYNLSRLMAPNNGGTYFQQKWKAKAATRGYHGEQIREKQWQRMFTSRLNAVVPMNHRYLAEFDGSELAAGRGSGLEEREKSRSNLKTPYMQMTYAPTERRLDIAIFRSLFASSARQARQFVTHGHVTVNGKKMPYPGYLLNPGDMFQVEPESVLFATGQTKDKEQVKAGREMKRARRVANTRRAEKRTAKREKALQAIANKKVAEELVGEPTPKAPRPIMADETEARKQRKADLQELVKQVKAILENKKAPPPAKRKQDLREINREIKGTMSVLNRKPVSEIETSIDALTSRLTNLYPSNPFARIDKKAKSKSKPASEIAGEAQSSTQEFTAEEKQKMREAVVLSRENPVDESKPYATPWAPRPYMSAFAFIPRYLEVNHNICSAVYLRHPVARPGLAEVPTPFSPEQMQLAFNWYLRRR